MRSKWMISVGRVLRVSKYFPLLVAGLLRYKANGITPESAYRAMRVVDGNTRGAINRLLIALNRRMHPVQDVDADFSSTEFGQIISDLRRDGYAILPFELDSETCDVLEEYARTHVAYPRLDKRPRVGEIYDPVAPLAAVYDFSEDDLLGLEVIQDVLARKWMQDIAAAYLGCEPVNDLVAMWWSTPAGLMEEYSGAAQLFHMDRDRIQFLKFFIYLTDVCTDTGPHVLVQGSHRAKPLQLRADRRFEDSEVLAHFPADSIVEICGPRGTIAVVDTYGMHKGKHPERGDRLVLQYEWANSLFGKPYRTFNGPIHSDALRTAVERSPRRFCRFLQGRVGTVSDVRG